MSLEGRIHDGTVVFDQPVTLAEGTRVRVEPVQQKNGAYVGQRSLLEELGDVVGAIDDLPEDILSTTG